MSVVATEGCRDNNNTRMRSVFILSSRGGQRKAIQTVHHYLFVLLMVSWIGNNNIQLTGTDAFLVPYLPSFPTTSSFNHENSFPFSLAERRAFLSNRADSSTLNAKRRRRRKEDDDTASFSDTGEESSFVSSAASEVMSSGGSTGTNELPDFDLDSFDAEGVEPASKTKISTNPDVITDVMMGDPNNMKVRSINELIADRSLERKFEFEDQGDASIPDFTQLAAQSPSSSAAGRTGSSGGSDGGGGGEMTLGKKKQRQVERRASAIQARGEESTSENLLSNIDFIKDEKGKVSPIKILESGAWLGIFLLVGWEFYINSPLFDRAAPMAPIVYELLL